MPCIRVENLDDARAVEILLVYRDDYGMQKLISPTIVEPNSAESFNLQGGLAALIIEGAE